MVATLQRNARFHSLIAGATGNDRLVALIEKLLSEMSRLIMAGYIKGEHEELMRALRQRNPQRARDAMWAHILAVKEKALAAVPGSLQASVPAHGAVARPRVRAAPGHIQGVDQ
jgi:DNA-binding GntR family transcriptional regulator